MRRAKIRATARLVPRTVGGSGFRLLKKLYSFGINKLGRKYSNASKIRCVVTENLMELTRV